MTYFPGTIGAWGFQAKASIYDPVKGHTGTDYMMKSGTALTCPVDGIVKKQLSQNEMGNTLYIQDNSGNIHVFAHLSEFKCKVGSKVIKNNLIALSGSSGKYGSPAHLHYEIISKTPEPGNEFMTRSLAGYNGYNIDPEIFLKSQTMPTTEYLSDWAKSAKENMVKIGVTDGKDPQKAVTREECWVMLDRLLTYIVK